MRRNRLAFTLLELMIVIAITALVLAVVLAAMNRSCTQSRRTYCLNKMRNLGVALINFSTANGRFPNSGTFASELDDPEGRGNIDAGGGIWAVPGNGENELDSRYPLRNWVVDILGYIEHCDIYELWTSVDKDPTGRLAKFDTPGVDRAGVDVHPNYQKGKGNGHYTISQTYLSLLICPDDQVAMDRGNLSYAVNGGIQRTWWNGNTLATAAPQPGLNNSLYPVPIDFTGDGYANEDDLRPARNMGLLWIGSPNGNSIHDVRRTPASVTDGLTTTILLGESLKVGYVDPMPDAKALGGTLWYFPGRNRGDGNAFEGTWANPDPDFCTFRISDDICNVGTNGNCGVAGAIGPPPLPANPPANWAKANSIESTDNYLMDPENINGAWAAPEGWNYLSSYHPSGVNVVMCDGSARFISSSIDGEVLAHLVSPAGGLRGMKRNWPVFMNPLCCDRDCDF